MLDGLSFGVHCTTHDLFDLWNHTCASLAVSHWTIYVRCVFCVDGTVWDHGYGGPCDWIYYWGAVFCTEV
jgi:hypothetical protein